MINADETGQSTTDQLHASCVVIKGQAVLICGPSGSGKSDLALQLIDRGAKLVSDDRVNLQRQNSEVFAEAPETITGKMEVSGLGIVDLDTHGPAPLALKVKLCEAIERFPMDRGVETMLGVKIPAISLVAHESSAAIKVEIALRTWPAMKQV